MSLVSGEEIQLINNDSKYRSYVTAVEKSLKNFESSTEWADLISSLGKLKKVLQSFPKYTYIPKRVSVCKRLAQCLHPALPSGVHLKALEVYMVAFQNMGPELLAKDLSLYSSGLFPLLATAALSVKPVLLSVYETFFVPLKKALRPCLTGLIIALLPGLEEGSDFYARTFTLLKQVCAAQADQISVTSHLVADDKYFYTCLWSAVISQSSIRFPAIQFILTNFENRNKLNACTVVNSPTSTANSSDSKTAFKSENGEQIDDQLYLIGNSIDLMINAICCCLQDMNSLVQRSILDLMCTCLPLNTTQITRNDKINLIVVAIHVILRRDMSLNRRIYSWFMGSSSSSSSSTPGGTNNNNGPNNSNNSSSATTAAATNATMSTSNSGALNSAASSSNSSNEIDDRFGVTYSEENYFNVHSKNLLITAIKALLNSRRDSALVQYLITDESSVGLNNLAFAQNTTSGNLNTTGAHQQSTSSQTTTTLKILKIVSNLVERQEIGQAIIDDILLDLLNYVYRECCSLNTMSQQSAAQMMHLKTRSMMTITGSAGNMSVSQSHATLLQYAKEHNEIKKATCNFLFQSFQLYFIWEFCAKKFDLICSNYVANNNTVYVPSADSELNMLNVSPAHICDIYEFILDLLTNSDIYNEIQTEFLPLMLKRIIQTINVYCSKMTNTDLSKSFLLCIKILNKTTPLSLANSVSSVDFEKTENNLRVVPKIIFPETSATTSSQQQQEQPQQTSNTNKQVKVSETTVKTRSSSKKKTTTTTTVKKGSLLIKKRSNTETSDDGKVESIVATLIDEIIETIELIEAGEIVEEDNNEDEIEETDEENMVEATSTTAAASQSLNNQQQYLIDACLIGLKQLCHTFIKSHVFANSTVEQQQQQESIDKSFVSLFYSTSERVTSSIDDDLTSGVNTVKMNPSCLGYLQSFQIMNKLLIKILFFPRESAAKANTCSAATMPSDGSSGKDTENGDADADFKLRLIAEFEDWIKDLFVISCSSFIPSSININANNALFEYQSITLNTIIELIHLSESVNSHFAGSNNLSNSSPQSSLIPSPAGGRAANGSSPQSAAHQQQQAPASVCLLQTIFTQPQIDLIFYSSKFGLITANMLWSNLITASSSSSNDAANISMPTSSSSSSSSSSSVDKRAAILFCLLHELLPDNLCEDIISSQLLAVAESSSTAMQKESDLFVTSSLQSRLDSFKRFVRLWHWSREMMMSNSESESSSSSVAATAAVASSAAMINGFGDGAGESNANGLNDISVSTVKYAKMKKTFERSLMIVLNMLASKDTPVTLTKQIKEWLLSSICDYNDLPRILDVLLVSLLHPSTARVSIQHFINKILTTSVLTSSSNLSSQSPSKSINFYLNNEESMMDGGVDTTDHIRAYESRVYAVSNEGGNVRYHVNGGTGASSAATTPAKTPTEPPNKLLLLTQVDQSGAVNKPQRNLNVELPLSILNAASLGAGGISLRINPFMVARNTPGSGVADLGDSLATSDDFADSASNDFDDSAKNARLLENYKAIKVGQMQKEKEKQQLLSLQKAQLSSSTSSIPASISPKNTSKDSTTTSTNTTPQKESANTTNNELIDHHDSSNVGVVVYDVVGASGGGSDDEEDYDDEELVVDDVDDDDVEVGVDVDEIYPMYNGNNGGANGGSGDAGSTEEQLMANSTTNNDEMEFYGSYNGSTSTAPQEDEEYAAEEDSASHNTEITLLGGSSHNLDKGGASPSLLKKFSKMKLPKKITNVATAAVGVTSSSEKKMAKLNVNKTLSTSGVVVPSDTTSLNSRYFKKFKFKRGNKADESTKSKDKSEKINLDKSGKSKTSQSLSAVSSATTITAVTQPTSIPSQQQSSRPAILSSSPRQNQLHHAQTSTTVHHHHHHHHHHHQQSARELVVDASSAIDANYAHMLIYINSNNIRVHQVPPSANSNNKLSVCASFSNSAFDHVRTMFVLRSIEQLLVECDHREFLSAVVATSITANAPSASFKSSLANVSRVPPVFSVHNEKFLDLIVRHLKTIYGASFYSQPNQQSAASAGHTQNSTPSYSTLNLNNITYMEAITFILLFYIRSYYPPSRFSLKINNNTSNTTTPSNRMCKSNSISTTSLHSATSTTTNQTSTSSLLTATTIGGGCCQSTTAPTSCLASHKPAHYDEDMFAENRNVQIYSLRLLGRLIKELVDLCKSNNSKLANSSGGLVQWYQALIELVDKCKLAKTLLHCFYATVCTPAQSSLAACVLAAAASSPARRQVECAYLYEMMNTLEYLIELERILADYQTIVRYYKSPGMSARSLQSANLDASAEDDLMLTFIPPKPKPSSQTATGNAQPTSQPQTQPQQSTTRYIAQQTIPNQSMFISSILHYLRSIGLVDYHIGVLKLVKNALPSCGISLKSISTYIIEQLCRNLLYITSGGLSSTTMGSYSSNMLPLVSYMSAMSDLINIPDFVITMLRELTFMLQYCLISTTGVLANAASLSLLMSLSDAVGSGVQQSDVQFKLFRQFQADSELNQAQARECLIQILPSILSTMAQVWQRCNLLLSSFNLFGVNVLFEQHIQQNNTHAYSWQLGHPLAIKQCITEMLNQVAQWNAAHFMMALGSVWGEKRRKTSRLFLEHRVIIELVKSLRALPITTILQTIADIIKQASSGAASSGTSASSSSAAAAASSAKDKKKSPLNIWLLQFAHAYLDSYMSVATFANRAGTAQIQPPRALSSNNASTPANADLAQSLCTFLKDCLGAVSTTSPYATACYFQLFRILHDSVNAVPALVDDKRFIKDIQDVTHKLFELCNSIVASSLQQTTWLRKNYAVRLMTTSVTTPSSSNLSAASLPQSASFTALSASASNTTTTSTNSGGISTSTSTATTANSTSNTSSNSTTLQQQQQTNGGSTTTLATTVSNASSGANSSGVGSVPASSSASTSTVVGGGPGVGGAMLIHNDSSHSLPLSASTSISASQQTINSSTTSGFASNVTGGTNAGAAGNSSTNPTVQTPKSGNEGGYNTFSDLDTDTGTNLHSIDSFSGVGDINDSNNNLIHSLHALNILAEYLAKILDIVYKSEEKDRLVVPLLVNLMSNLWPYLKTHSVANKNNFRAASHLLMSLTVYPYTRKTWKKEVFEMLFDNLFFHVDAPTLEYSKSIIDNLISNDRTMFKDVLTRVTYQQSGGLFSSKEQESESKAQLLKRLAFVIYSSEKDQYQKNMPEIQECISHVLKLTQSANLYSTLLLLFRILILRISSRHLIALWPTIISELIMILLQIEQDLSDDLETKNSRSTYLDHIAITTNSYQHSSAGKLQIYLSACKLIDLILTLPNSLTPQFQLYKWSFINTEDALNMKQKDQFVPYLTKISVLLKIKYPNHKTPNVKLANGPLIRQRLINALADLKPFFDTVTTHAFVHNSSQSNLINNHQYQQTQNLLTSTNLRLFEANVHEDFLEGWTQA